MWASGGSRIPGMVQGLGFRFDGLRIVLLQLKIGAFIHPYYGFRIGVRKEH